MRVLFINGSDYYHFLMFEQSSYSVQDIVTLCENSETKKISIDDEETFFDAELLEFGEVDAKFIEWIKSKQDYDDAKHSNWVVVD
jgi:hypothetical protein